MSAILSAPPVGMVVLATIGQPDSTKLASTETAVVNRLGLSLRQAHQYEHGFCSQQYLRRGSFPQWWLLALL